ncbi:MAG: hypothetical protein ACLFQB_14750 [Chitinispirillaceae bacterium]
MEDKHPVTPWGVASLRINSKRDSSFSGVAGFSRQYYTQSKPYRRQINRNITYLNSGYLSLRNSVDIINFADLKVKGTLEVTDWNGQIIRDTLVSVMKTAAPFHGCRTTTPEWISVLNTRPGK